MRRTTTLRLGASFGALGVVAGAFGAHALKAHLSAEDLATHETAARYLLIHALGLCVIAACGDGRRLRLAATAMAIGTAIFSGSLFALVLSGLRWLGAITPIGGVLMIAGWILLATASLPSDDAAA
ncbi:MAG: DUF423 domain-containing protein [Planctomycetota bacterium]